MPQPPWMPIAWAELGQREIAGTPTNPRITRYFRRAGHSEIGDDETAWCAAFVGACLEDASLKSTSSLAARSYLAWGVDCAQPQLGAITVLSRGNDPSLGHVGFLAGYNDARVYLLGGNQSNSVSVAAFDRDRVLGFRLPSAKDVPAAKPVAATVPQSEATDAMPDDAGFSQALIHVLAFEGGWSDDPFDPGGATNKGITLATLARERGIAITPTTEDNLKAELRRIGDAEVRRIYLERYWGPARCPELPAPLAFFHFDCAVNQGVNGAARMLQEALAVTVDGEIGPITLHAAHSGDSSQILSSYSGIRRRHYQSLVHYWRFGRGWMRRLEATTTAARRITGAGAAGSSPRQSQSTSKERSPMSEAPTIAFPTAPQANSQPTGATPKWWGESLTIWGALLTAVSTVAPAIFAAFGIDLPGDLIQRLGRVVMVVVQAVAGLAGTLMTILGRIRASQPLERRALNVRL